jgi:hypothetical protein
MARPPSTPAEEPDLRQLVRQRDLAVVVAALLAVVAVAALWNNFAKASTDLETTNTAVVQHRELLAENQRVMDAVQTALASARQEVERLGREQHRGP